MPVTDERRTSLRRRETGRAAARRSARARADAPEHLSDDERTALHAPTDQVLPPGRRDASGFWIPEGYDVPEALFSPHQRRLQEKQRQAHRARRRRGAADDDETDPGADGDARVDSPDPSE